MIDRLPFGRSTFSKLVKIGNDRRLTKIRKHLPASYSTIYEISQLPDEQLRGALKTGIICPEVKRADLEELKDSSKAKTRRDPPRTETSKTRQSKRDSERPSSEEDIEEEDFSELEDVLDDDESTRERQATFDGLKRGWIEKGRLTRSDWKSGSPNARKRFVSEILLPGA